MAADIVAVMAEIGIAEADVVGYSMGGALAIRLMHDAPGRVRRAVIGGIGETYFHPSPERAEIIAAGFLAADPAEITDSIAREFRTFCERAGDDLLAMAACMRRQRRVFTPEELKDLATPVLVVCGADDDVSGSPEPLARAFANGHALAVPRRSHHSTVGDRAFKDAAVQFLAH
jgi:pimeloyl-ACP methyl ester carboxylesterase